MSASATEIALLDRWQRGFPLEARPYRTVGASVGLSENATIETFANLVARRLVTRIGAVVRPHTAGASTLAAMRVPAERMEEVAGQVSAEPLVNHNYEREHAFNLWFVVAGPDEESVEGTLTRIEQASGIEVVNLPMIEAYHLDLGFPLSRSPLRPARRTQSAAVEADAEDRELLAAMEDGLPLSQRPYRAVGERIGRAEDDVIDSIRRLTEAGVIARFGCIVSHRALGYVANAMCVFDVPDAFVDDVAARMIRIPSVTLCYRRRRHLPEWPYNLFCMIHAKTRDDARAALDDVNAVADAQMFNQAVLFSTRCFKQRGARFSRVPERVE